MKTIEINLYQFSELPEDAKQKTIENLSDINVDHEWWECTYEDAKRVGIKIIEFDLERNRHCKGEFIDSAVECAEKIKKDHGEDCETFKTAKSYLEDRDKFVGKYSDGDGESVTKDNEDAFDSECDDLDADFLQSILEDYSIMLQKEYEYLQSTEAIIETIEANEYDFTEDGKIY